jgi:hypothetical protein
MLHEHSHLAGPHGRGWQMAEGPYRNPSNAALEEGVTEAWSAAHMNDYIDALGVEKLAPGIKGTVTRQPYPQYVPATEVLAYGIGQDTRQSGDGASVDTGMDTIETIRRDYTARRPSLCTPPTTPKR